jgi:hypothetical protein
MTFEELNDMAQSAFSIMHLNNDLTNPAPVFSLDPEQNIQFTLLHVDFKKIDLSNPFLPDDGRERSQLTSYLLALQTIFDKSVELLSR